MNINAKLNRVKNEDLVWIIYFFIIIAALYSNTLEKDYYLHHSKETIRKSKNINTIILIVAFFIYLYFVLINTEDISHIEKNFHNKEFCLQYAHLIGALLFLIGGLIFIIVEVLSDEPILLETI